MFAAICLVFVLVVGLVTNNSFNIQQIVESGSICKVLRVKFRWLLFLRFIIIDSSDVRYVFLLLSLVCSPVIVQSHLNTVSSVSKLFGWRTNLILRVYIHQEFHNNLLVVLFLTDYVLILFLLFNLLIFLKLARWDSLGCLFSRCTLAIFFCRFILQFLRLLRSIIACLYILFLFFSILSL